MFLLKVMAAMICRLRGMSRSKSEPDGHVRARHSLPAVGGASPSNRRTGASRTDIGEPHGRACSTRQRIRRSGTAATENYQNSERCLRFGRHKTEQTATERRCYRKANSQRFLGLARNDKGFGGPVRLRSGQAPTAATVADTGP